MRIFTNIHQKEEASPALQEMAFCSRTDNQIRRWVNGRQLTQVLRREWWFFKLILAIIHPKFLSIAAMAFNPQPNGRTGTFRVQYLSLLSTFHRSPTSARLPRR
ncbi:hypothetical protein B0H12DRAFT_164564 [Mycena haematopus]|nr:hypothetical protein B0H12DRAFT_164564 [Mycena haematopus]